MRAAEFETRELRATCYPLLGYDRRRRGVAMAVIEKQGRVIRRYRRNIPLKDFEAWSEYIRSRAGGCGLYALYAGEQLLYVGVATKSIRSRIRTHKNAGKIPFTHFSAFLVTGKSCAARVRRIRDLEALLLKVIKPKPPWNKSITKFVAAKRLPKPNKSVQGTRRTPRR